MRYDYLYGSDMISRIRHAALPARSDLPRIEVHAWGDLLGAHGAGALALGAVTDRSLGAVTEAAA